MAENKPTKKPRLRKTAPTIRERVETTQLEESKASPKRSKGLAVAKAVGRRLRLPRNRATAPIFRILAPIGRVLRFITPKYFIDSWREVRQVTWPTRRETWRLTGAVFVFAVIFGAMVAAVDKGLDAIFKNVILK